MPDRPSEFAAVAQARAMCLRDGGPLDTVEYLRAGSVVESYTASPYDALGAARDAARQIAILPLDDVRLVLHTGRTLAREEILTTGY